MNLSNEDARLYLTLLLPLLAFVNKRCGIIQGLSSKELKEATNRLCDNINLIDEYLALNSELAKEERAIIASWKKFKRGKFYVERHLEDGTIMISLKDEGIFKVVGVLTSLEKLLSNFSLPLVVEATLFPFKEVIITDGLLTPYKVKIEDKVAKSFIELYLMAKETETIIDNIR